MKPSRSTHPRFSDSKVVASQTSTFTCGSGRGQHVVSGVGFGNALTMGALSRAPVFLLRHCFRRPSAAVLSLLIGVAAVGTPGAGSKPRLYATAEGAREVWDQNGDQNGFQWINPKAVA